MLQLCYAPVSIRRLGQRIIQTSLGRYRGVVVEFPAGSGLKIIEAFLGINYAKSSLQFMPPSDKWGKWTNVREMHNFSDVCPQRKSSDPSLLKNGKYPTDPVRNGTILSMMTQHQHEDCLALNLYVPFQGIGINPIRSISVYLYPV